MKQLNNKPEMHPNATDAERAMYNNMWAVFDEMGWEASTHTDDEGYAYTYPRVSGTDGTCTLMLTKQAYNKPGMIAVHAVGWGSINVSASKTPKQISGDIKRRILNNARESQKELDAYKAEETRRADLRKVAITRLTSETAAKYNETYNELRFYINTTPAYAADFRVNSDGSSINLDLRALTLDQTIAVLNAIESN
jgi:hypothetical protein